MNNTLAVLGAGIWGTALAITLAKNGQHVRLWDIDSAHIQGMIDTGYNQSQLPNIKLPNTITPTLALSDALSDIQDCLIVAPSHAFRALITQIAPLLADNARLIWATKGFDAQTLSFFHEMIPHILNKPIPMAVLSGPSFAREVAQGQPTQVVIASENEDFLDKLYQRFNAPAFQIEKSHDMIGVQLCGALKNVLAIAIGMSDGLSLGANARCALITRGLKNLATLGKSMGAQPETFYSFAGLGDLILTCTDNQSRNRSFGFALGQGLSVLEATQKINKTIEGKETAKHAHALIQKHHASTPILEQVYAVIYEGKSAKSAITELLGLTE